MVTKKKKQAEDIINSVINNTVDEVIEPEKFEAQVSRLAPNPKLVYGVLDSIQIVIYMPRNREKSVGRRVIVEKAEELGEDRYKISQ